MHHAEFFRQLASRYYRVARRCSDPLLAKQLMVKANRLVSKAQTAEADGSVLKHEPKRRSDPE